MITITQGIKDLKVQVSVEGRLVYEFTNSTVELSGCYLRIKSQNNTLVSFFSSECEWFMVVETP